MDFTYNMIFQFELIVFRSAYVVVNSFIILDWFDTAFKELHETCKEFCWHSHQIFSKVIRKSHVVRNPPLFSLTIAGSLAEGSILARWFLPQKNLSFFPNFEADMEWTFGELSSSLKHCVEDIRNKSGFIKVQVEYDNCYCPNCIKYKDDIIHIKSPNEISAYINTFTNHNGFLMPIKIKEKSRQNGRYDGTNTKYLENVSLIYAMMTNKAIQSVAVSNMFSQLTKATYSYGFDIGIDSTIQARISVDFSFNIKIHWIPEVTHKWLSRHHNKWPPIDMLHNELKYSYVIAKPSCAEKNNENTIEFRYSFAHIERRIFSLMSDTQRLIYFIFKIMFYKWIIPINEEMITSYIAKTTMLWMAEEYPPQHVLWKQASVTIFNTVRVIFQRLSTYCQQHYLPYFFVSQINVFDCMSHQIIIYMGSKAEKISNNITQYFPNNIEDVKSIGEQTINLMKRFEPMIDDGSFIDILDKIFHIL